MKKTIRVKEEKKWNNQSLDIERVLWIDGSAFIQAKFTNQNTKEVYK